MSIPLVLNQAKASDMKSSQYDSDADSPGSLDDFIDNDDINMADAISSDVPPIIGQKRSHDILLMIIYMLLRRQQKNIPELSVGRRSNNRNKYTYH
jgi:hypothetical protein